MCFSVMVCNPLWLRILKVFILAGMEACIPLEGMQASPFTRNVWGCFLP